MHVNGNLVLSVLYLRYVIGIPFKTGRKCEDSEASSGIGITSGSFAHWHNSWVQGCPADLKEWSFTRIRTSVKRFISQHDTGRNACVEALVDDLEELTEDSSRPLPLPPQWSDRLLGKVREYIDASRSQAAKTKWQKTEEFIENTAASHRARNPVAFSGLLQHVRPPRAVVYRDISGRWESEGEDIEVPGHLNYVIPPKKHTASLTLQQKENLICGEGLDHDGDTMLVSGVFTDASFVFASYEVLNKSMHVHGFATLQLSGSGDTLAGFYLGRETGQGTGLIFGRLQLTRCKEPEPGRSDGATVVASVEREEGAATC